MKYILAIADGMGDYPLKELGGKTPLQIAKTPNMNKLAKEGRCGRFITIPKGMTPGSAVANMSILGYDPKVSFQGRGVLEAASMGVNLNPEDVALRCNLICVKDNKIKNHSAGHISTQEAAQLIRLVNDKLGSELVKFYPGVSYRHLLVLKDDKFSPNVECTPPHDVLGIDFKKVLVKPKEKGAQKTASLLNKLIISSQGILKNHPINVERKKQGKDMANMIWPWSPGKKPIMQTFQERFNIKGAVISAVDLIRGLGVYSGFDIIKVEGATGLYNTNYEGKANACVNALKDYDFVYVHVEAPDEASHEGDLKLKIKTIEDFDKRLLGKILNGINKFNEDVSIALLPDHLTPIKVRTHVDDPVPFLIYTPGKTPDSIKEFNEFSCRRGGLGLFKGDAFIKKVICDE